MRRIRPISHDDRLSVIDHLDELRTRLIICALAFGAAWALTGWQNDLVLEIVNHPLPDKIDEPITLGPAEAFYTTLTNSAYAAMLIALPVILYQLYAFILPAMTPDERRVTLPLMLTIPFLFIGGVVFAYFVVMPAAVNFLLNFNETEFNIQVRAREYYSFFALTLVALGFLFQVPVPALAGHADHLCVRDGVLEPRHPLGVGLAAGADDRDPPEPFDVLQRRDPVG